MKLNLPEQDTPAKIFNTIQFIVFLALFIGIYLFARHFVRSFWLRILCLIGDYVICALISFCVLKPLSDKAAQSLREKNKK